MRPELAAVLIVRDEQEALPACLASLAGVVDEVVVHDTGSADATVQVAREAGARVTAGGWDGDFAKARNAALAGTAARWVLSLDADERVVADPAALRRALREQGDDVVGVVRVRNQAPAGLGGRWSSGAARLFAPAASGWVGAVHEVPAPRDGRPARLLAVPEHVLALDHTGYADPQVLLAKSRRNADLGRAELDALLAGPPRGRVRVPRVMLDLARSLSGAGRPQDALDVLTALLDAEPPAADRAQALDQLARLLLAAGHDELVVAITDQLAGLPGADDGYVAWLRAQALAQLGDVRGAAALLQGVEHLTDTLGNRPDPSALAELKQLVASLVQPTPHPTP